MVEINVYKISSVLNAEKNKYNQIAIKQKTSDNKITKAKKTAATCLHSTRCRIHTNNKKS